MSDKLKSIADRLDEGEVKYTAGELARRVIDEVVPAVLAMQMAKLHTGIPPEIADRTMQFMVEIMIAGASMETALEVITEMHAEYEQGGDGDQWDDTGEITIVHAMPEMPQ